MAHDLKRILDEEEGDNPSESAGPVQPLIEHYFLPEFSALVPQLSQLVKTNPDTTLRIRAAEALVLWGGSAENPLTLLIECLTSSTKREDRLAAVQALGHIGPPAVSAILPLLQILKEDDSEIRSASIQALLLIRPEPDPAGFLVDSIMSNEVDTHEAIRLLVGLGRPVVTQLVPKLASERSGERYLAVKALAKIGWAPLEAISAVLDSLQFDDCWNSLLERGRLFAPDRRMESFFWFDAPEAAMQQALHHSEVEVRRLVTSLLANGYKPKSANLLPDLMTAVQDSDDDVRGNAAKSLIQLAHGELSLWDRVMPQLVLTVRDSSVHVRRSLFDSLHWMDDRPSDRKALLAILAASDPDERLRAQAAEGLNASELDLPAQVQTLIDVVEASEVLDEYAVQRLRNLGLAAAAAVPCLVTRLGRETDLRNRSLLAFALAAIDPQLAIVCDLLNDADWYVRYLTLAGLSSSGRPLDSLKPLILQRRSDEDNSVRHQAAALLWSLDQDVEPYLTVLLGILRDQPLYTCKERVLFNGEPLNCLRDGCWPEVTDEILKLARSDAVALAQIASTLEDAEWQNLHLLRLNWELFHNASVISDVAGGLDGDFHASIASAELLQRIGPAARAAVPKLRRQLTHRYYLYRLHSLQVLQHIGPGAEAALGDVVQLLGGGTIIAAEDDVHGLDLVRTEAAITIGSIVPELDALVPTLKLIADNEYVRNALASVAKDVSVEAVKAMLCALAHRHGIAPAITNTTTSDQPATTTPIDVVALVGLLTDEPFARRRGAALALANLGPSAVLAIPNLVRLLREDQSTAMRDIVIVALGRFGAAAVAPLQELIRHSDWIVRLEAAEALYRTDALPADELPSIFALVDDVDGSDPGCYGRQLAPVTFRRVLNQICELLDSRLSEYVLIESQRRLLGPFSMLIQARGWWLRDCAIFNLGRLGHSAAPLVPLVLDAMHDPDWIVRLAALGTITKIATPNEEILAAINIATSDEHAAVRNQALAALQSWNV